jgi:hypothetical protein
MNVLHLIDELDNLVHHDRTRRLRNTGQARVNADNLKVLVAQLQIALPQAINTRSLTIDDAFVASRLDSYLGET